MADIDVERRGPSLWAWVIGLVVLALLVWLLVEMFGSRSDPPVLGPAADTLGVDTAFVAPVPVTTPDTSLAPLMTDTPTVMPLPSDTPAAGALPRDTAP